MKGLLVPEMVENLYRCRLLSFGMWRHEAGLWCVSVLVPWIKGTIFYRAHCEGMSFIHSASVYQNIHSSRSQCNNLHSYQCESLWST